MFFHPKHCPSAVTDKSCFDVKCTLTHRIGTKRFRRDDQESSSRRKINVSNESTSPLQRRKGIENQNNKARQSRKNGHSNPANEDFLEIRYLLTTFHKNFQRQIDDLKSSIATQENKLMNFLPTLNQYMATQFLPRAPESQPFMFHQPVTTQQNGLSHVPPHPLSWLNIPVSGC